MLHTAYVKNRFRNFLEGMASISFFPVLQSYADITEGKTDEELIAQDWAIVLSDIDKAIERVGEAEIVRDYFKKSIKTLDDGLVDIFNKHPHLK